MLVSIRRKCLTAKPERYTNMDGSCGSIGSELSLNGQKPKGLLRVESCFTTGGSRHLSTSSYCFFNSSGQLTTSFNGSGDFAFPSLTTKNFFPSAETS